MTPKPERTTHDDITEMLDRTRRIETRLTSFMEAQGYDTGIKRANWRAKDGTVVIPSPAVALKEMLAAIPPSWTGDIIIEHKGERLGLWTPAAVLPDECPRCEGRRGDTHCPQCSGDGVLYRDAK